MKKLLRFALSTVCTLSLVACTDDDPPTPQPPTDPSITITGAYVVSEGNYYSHINGSLTAYDPATKESKADVFAVANGRALSGTPNDATVHGTKLYITNTEENIVEVADAKTARSIAQISLNGARCVRGYEGYIYVTSFTEGTVYKIDTVNYELAATLSVDANPEDMAIVGGKLYVPNSGYGAGNTVSVIDLASFTNEQTLTVPTNPTKVFAYIDKLFLVCSGKYAADYSGYEEDPALYTLSPDGTTTKIGNATMAAAGFGYIYYINNNFYSTTGITYSRYDVDNSRSEVWDIERKPFAPYAIGVSPSDGHIYVSSYNSIDYGTGVLYPNYNGECNVTRYGKCGLVADEFTAGVNAGTIIFF